jgi:hypothetical protein
MFGRARLTRHAAIAMGNSEVHPINQTCMFGRARLTRHAAIAMGNDGIPSLSIGSAISTELDSCALAGNETTRREGPLRSQTALVGLLCGGAPTCRSRLAEQISGSIWHSHHLACKTSP